MILNSTLSLCRHSTSGETNSKHEHESDKYDSSHDDST